MTLLLATLLFAATPEDSFDSTIRPVLTQHCLKCHKGDKPKAGLDLTGAEKILTGSKGGPVVVPGNSEGSLLSQVLVAGHDTHMPPDGQLSPAEMETIGKWIKALPKTAVAPRKEMQVTDKDRSHWSFRPVAAVTPPVVQDAAIEHSIDRFIVARLEQQKLKLAPRAEPRTLIRRLHFTLTGLPPTPDDVDKFVEAMGRDPKQAVEGAVDRLLASPHYGERWARHWLDVARYTDIDNDPRQIERPDASSAAGTHHYRDYVIRCLNADKPFDQFIKEQIAGDRLSPGDREALIATAFLRLSPPSGAPEPKARFDDLDDMLSTVSSVFIGLTVGCARCHDHKTDPIPQRDYYRLMAVFNGTDRKTEPIPSATEKEAYESAQANRKKELEELQAKLSELEEPKDDVREDDEIPKAEFVGPPKMSRWWRDREREANKTREKLQALQGEPSRFATAPVVAEKDDPPQAHLLLRGDPRAPSDEVTPGVPVVLPGNGFTESERRVALAKWIGSADNPLTARVIVNRVWHYHFGRGLVGTPSNFGISGEAPTHPELLDYLAQEFIRGGWSLKKLHRLILTSATYQQSCAESPDAKRLDPDNKLWSHFQRRRLEAEALRDAILYVSGALNPVMFGPGARARPGDVNLAPEAARSPLAVREGPQQWRRSLYLGVSRSNPSIMLESFDQPPPACPCDKRTATTVPTQALLMLNAPFIIEQAEYLAKRVKKEAGKDAAAQVERLYRLTLGRPPRDSERAKALAFLDDPVIRLRAGRRPGVEDIGPLADLAHIVLNLNEFLYLD